MPKETGEIEALLEEKRVFKPSEKLVNESNVKVWMDKHGIKSYEELLERAKNSEWFWEEIAKELEWFKPWEKVLEWDTPFAKWFVGGKINIVHNALDRHIKTEKKDKIAYIWVGEPGDVKKLTYQDLYVEVNRFANALKKLGVKKGDKVTLYMPMIPELPIAMLACAKIGAIHSVVFSGFSPKALEGRINDAEAKILVTADGFYRRGKIISLKRNADEGLKNTPTIEKCIVVRRIGKNTRAHGIGFEVPTQEGRDIWWDEIVKDQPDSCETEVMDSEDILYILYTSGTTGRPKGVVHVHGGYGVGIYTTLKWVFDVKDSDIWWCAADIGWVTGHSYIVYAPLMMGATSIMYEGAPNYPEPDRWWKIIEKYKVTIIYTAPTAIRLFMKFGDEWPNKHDLSSLRLLGSVGEPINPEAWMWYYNIIGKGRCQIMDTWWQTETGNFIITPLPITPLKPGSATKPFPGIEVAIYDRKGNPLVGKGGSLVIKTPWPAMLRTLYKDPERYKQTYWSKYRTVYLTGDAARIDKDGYFWIQGREDDVLKVAGHRIGTAEIESALVSHQTVAEAAAVGKPDELKGEVPKVFVILKMGVVADEELKKTLINHVRKEIGSIAKPEEIVFVDDLPKTRSGKIMRRVIKAIVRGEPVGDITTLRNPEAVEALKKLAS